MKPDPDYVTDPAPDSLSAAAAAAAGWVARRNAGLTAVEQQKLQSWLAADPAHRTAFAHADAERTEVDWALHAGVVDQVLVGLELRAARRQRRRRVLVAASAAALLLVTGIVWRTADPAHVAPSSPAMASVRVFEPRRLTLPDGSSAELRDGAEVTFDFTGLQRRVTLQRGAAHFQVAHDTARPFVVSSSGLEVRAVGTAFSVELDAKDVEVVVTEGRVAVGRTAPPTVALASPVAGIPEPVLVDAGHGLLVRGSAAVDAVPEVRALPEAVMRERLAWRVPRLEFVGTPLAEVVAVMNRHNRVQFTLADAELGNLQLSGVVSADKVEALQDMLEAAFAIRAERQGDRILLRSAR
jgi:transmembrane sensor